MASTRVGGPTEFAPPSSSERGSATLGLVGAGGHAPHALHGDDRAWPETNCYVDLWIESLHALGLDPTAALAFTLAVDFEGDQYTFFKFPHADLEALYGIEVQELNPWRGVAEHAVEQVALGRLYMPEVDAFFLPDTAGLNHRIEHTKTSIAIHDIDLAARRLGYFHSRSYYAAEGDDFDGIFRLGAYAVGPEVLPPFVEIGKADRLVRRPASELAALAVRQARVHLARRPATNPVSRHRARFARDVEWLRGEQLSVFHGYAFATVRQLGACTGLSASFLEWLAAHGESGLEPAIAAYTEMSSAAKMLQFKLARVVGARRDADLGPLLDQLEEGWARAVEILDHRLGG